jgi:polyamine oxidase
LIYITPFNNSILIKLVKRLKNDQVDLSGRASLDIVGWHPKTPLDYAVEYYVYDWEMGEDAEVSSSIFTAINDNWTYTSFGPNSDGDNMVVDNR